MSYTSVVAMSSLNINRVRNAWHHSTQSSMVPQCLPMLIHAHGLGPDHVSAGREIREQMFEKVAELLHDLDEGMIPITTIAPYLPIAAHRKRDK